ncbi:hypothetical protein ACL02S_23525 [Nocardia sp. 004]|uniref:hypothetical protein n=1 Tax=Nocardia sp. 004 TaxID=3385978 RepID=UPI0039A12F72
MENTSCPRCGKTFQRTGGRGRPKVWCSTDCRWLAFAERRAARRGGKPVEIHEEIRERVVERSRPISPDGAVDRVLSDPGAIQKLLRVLAHRMRADPPLTEISRWTFQRFKPLLYDLWQAYHQALDGTSAAMPEVLPADYTPARTRTEAHREAVALVLNSPRSTSEVLTVLADRARDGLLGGGEHARTVAAADELHRALVISHALRSR